MNSIGKHGKHILTVVIFTTLCSSVFALEGYVLLLQEEFKPGRLDILNVKTGERKTLDNGPCAYPCFTPDGKKAVFAKGNKFYIVDASGSGSKTAVDAGCNASALPQANWVSTGGQDYIYWAENAGAIYRINVATNSKETIFTSSKGFYSLSVSSDGSRGACTKPSWSVWKINIAGKSESKLGNGCQGAISPNGKYITQNHDSHKTATIHDFNSSGSIKTLRTPKGTFNAHHFSHTTNDYIVYTVDGNQAYVCHWKTDTKHHVGKGAPRDYFPGKIGDPVEDNTPPSAPSNLSATARGKSQIDLSWDAASDGESGVGSYTIYRDGQKVATSSNTSHSDKSLNEGTTYRYRVSAVNGEGMEGEKSNESSATTEADNDTTPPDVSSVIAQSATSVKVTFTEFITKESAEKTENYSISDGVGVTNASLQGDNTSVVLTTSPLTEGTTYTLTASNITDRSPNANTGGGQKQFTLSADIQISNLTVASGTSYEIVESIAEGDKQYVDRNYAFSSLGDCAGMYYIRTANDDKEESGDSFLSFDINRGATVRVAYRHGSDLPPWLSSWSKTGDEVCGDGCSDVYEKDFDGGTVILGGNKPGGAGNMYSVFVDGGGATISSPDRNPSGERAARIGAYFRGDLLRVTGLYLHGEYSITLTDARGRVTSRPARTGSRGTVELSTIHSMRGVYLVNIRFGRQRCTVRAVAP